MHCTQNCAPIQTGILRDRWIKCDPKIYCLNYQMFIGYFSYIYCIVLLFLLPILPSHSIEVNEKVLCQGFISFWNFFQLINEMSIFIFKASQCFSKQVLEFWKLFDLQCWVKCRNKSLCSKREYLLWFNMLITLKLHSLEQWNMLQAEIQKCW